MSDFIGKFDGSNGEIKTIDQMNWKEYLTHKNYNKDINSMCSDCQKRQMDKHGKIVIKCNGLATYKSYIPEDKDYLFSDDDKDLLEQTANPYYWADKNIDVDNINPEKRLFAPRWYQEQISRCTAHRKAIRCGRRAGKSYSLALNILHRALTNNNYYILIVTPFEVQSEEIINLILQFARNLNPEFGTYESLGIKHKGSPNHTITFSNGSRIKAFTAGANGAGSVRGQRADLIVLDEVDYLDQKAFNSIIAILADKPETELWASSTPDGEKQLYKLSNDPFYREFHFPSFVIPHYNDNLDAEFRKGTDSIGYVQEIMAEFGASKAGVFQKYYLELSQSQEYIANPDDVLTDRRRFIVIMGCDWNHDQIGTRISVVAFDRMAGKMFVVERFNVSKEGWSQIAAINKIIQANRKYVFDHMYVDEGFGATQIQALRMYGNSQIGKLPPDHPDLKLLEVVPVNFSSTLEVTDPYTGEKTKKRMKPFIVENTNRFLEKLAIKLDPIRDKSLIEQMKGYEEKRGPSGIPTYAASNDTVGDHDLDAFMIACYGFQLEYGELFESNTFSISVITQESMYNYVQGKMAEDNYSEDQGLGIYIDETKRGYLRPNNRTSLFNEQEKKYNDDKLWLELGYLPANNSNISRGNPQLFKKTIGRRASF